MNTCKSASPVNTTLQVIGGKWKPVILWNLTTREYRFGDLLKSVTGITQKMLTSQLRELEADHVVHRKVYPVIPPKVEYSITPYGKTLIPVLKSMAAWGEKHKQVKKK